jgi:Fe-S cluster assembly protein SufD
LLFLSSSAGADSPIVSYPRVLVIADENSESSLVETYAGSGQYLCNAVTEIVQGRGARIDHNKLQQESETAYHIALMQVDLAAASLFVSHSTSMGSKLTRNDLQVFLGGEGAEATLNGLVYARGEQHIDNHTILHHEKAHCPSHELYKHVLADKATAVFKGKIFVQKDAQKTDSKQTSKTLLLSDEAAMNSQPALEIYADDVKCTHGSTTGPVDANAVFYLVSRGLSLDQARHLMTYAFAADITRRIKVTPVRARIEDFMAAQHGLPQDLRITEGAAHDVALL